MAKKKEATLDDRLIALKDELAEASVVLLEAADGDDLRRHHYDAIGSAIRGLEAALEQKELWNRDWIREPV